MIFIFALLRNLLNDNSYFSNSSSNANSVWCSSTSHRFLGGGGLGFLPRFLGGGGGSSNFSQSFLRVSMSYAESSKPSAIVFFGSGGSCSSSSSAGGGVGGEVISGSGDGVLFLSYIWRKVHICWLCLNFYSWNGRYLIRRGVSLIWQASKPHIEGDSYRMPRLDSVTYMRSPSREVQQLPLRWETPLRRFIIIQMPLIFYALWEVPLMGKALYRRSRQNLYNKI